MELVLFPRAVDSLCGDGSAEKERSKSAPIAQFWGKISGEIAFEKSERRDLGVVVRSGGEKGRGNGCGLGIRERKAPKERRDETGDGSWPERAERREREQKTTGPSSKPTRAGFWFWLFLLSLVARQMMQRERRERREEGL